MKRAGIVLALLLPSIALAQRINLDDTPAPAAGSGLAALALADELEKEAAELGKGEATALGAARIAVRRLARDLLKAGEQDGATGSVRVLVGRTIAARRFGLDECLRAPGVDGPMLEALARDLAVPAGGFPADPAGLDRLLRDALAPLVQASVTQGAHGGWIGAEPEGAMEPPPPLGTVARVAGLAPEAVRVFEELDSRLNTAKGWVAYRPSALATERLVRRAMLVVEKNRPEWLGDEAQTRLRTDLLAAVGELAAGGDTVGAGASLRRLSAFAGAAGAAQRLDQGRGARALRAAIGEILTGPAWAGDPGLTARLHAMRRMLDLLADVPGPEDKAVVRQLRPALRALEPAARQSAAQLLETLPRLLKQPDALSDPAVLGAMTAHEHRVADVALIKEISGSMAETGASGEAVARGALKPLADRLLTLGQDLNKAETRDIALTELREVGRQLRDYKEMPGEKELRAGVQGAAPEWGAVGERITDLPAAIDQARAAWLAERTAPKGIPTPPKARRLAVLRAGVRALADGAGARRVIELGDSAALNAWPGWELSREALAVITGGLFDQTSKLVGQLVTGQDDEAEASISRITAQHGAALLMGRLEWRAEELGLRPQAFGAADALVQIALGPPDPDTAWLARVDMDLRSDLAAVCRYAEESALAQAKKDNAKAQVFRGYYNGRARAALERLESQNRP